MIIHPSKVNLLEKDIEDYLWANPTEVEILAGGQHYFVERWLARQLKVPSGIIDLFGILNTGWAVVVEVKNVAIDARALAQVKRYAADIDATFATRYEYEAREAICIAIGESIDAQSMYEAEALNVIPLVFSVSLSMGLNRSRWTEEHRRQIDKDLTSLSCNEDVFGAFDHHFRMSEEEYDFQHRQDEDDPETDLDTVIYTPEIDP